MRASSDTSGYFIKNLIFQFKYLRYCSCSHWDLRSYTTVATIMLKHSLFIDALPYHTWLATFTIGHFFSWSLITQHACFNDEISSSKSNKWSSYFHKKFSFWSVNVFVYLYYINTLLKWKTDFTWIYWQTQGIFVPIVYILFHHGVYREERKLLK